MFKFAITIFFKLVILRFFNNLLISLVLFCSGRFSLMILFPSSLEIFSDSILTFERTLCLHLGPKNI